MKEEKKILIKLSKFRIKDKVYFYDGLGCTRVEILDVYFIDYKWYYEIDCSNYKQDMILEYVSEDYLGLSTNPKKHNKRFSSRNMKGLADMVTY